MEDVKTYSVTLKGKTWLLEENSAGVISVKYIEWGGDVSRTQIKAINREAALQYIYQTYNGDIPYIEWDREVQDHSA